MVVARSTLRAIAFVCARCASLRLTSIAPTLAVAASIAIAVAAAIAIVVAAAIHTESKTIQIFTDIQISAYISHDDTQAPPHRSPSPHTSAAASISAAETELLFHKSRLNKFFPYFCSIIDIIQLNETQNNQTTHSPVGGKPRPGDARQSR
jgi:hypothetical protein